MKEKIVKYENYFLQYETAQKIFSNHLTNAMVFINKGAETAYVNNFPLATNDSLAITGNQNEVDETTYDINFSTGGGTQQLWVIRKENKYE